METLGSAMNKLDHHLLDSFTTMAAPSQIENRIGNTPIIEHALAENRQEEQFWAVPSSQSNAESEVTDHSKSAESEYFEYDKILQDKERRLSNFRILLSSKRTKTMKQRTIARFHSSKCSSVINTNPIQHAPPSVCITRLL